MKRSDQKVPGFDDIIFENRNKRYGAYDLRRKYKATACLSILGGITLCSLPLIIFSVLSSEPVSAKTEKGIFVVISPDNLSDPGKIVQPEPPKPVKSPPQFKYVSPKVVDDTMNLSFMIKNDIAIDSVVNAQVIEESDSVVYSPPVTDIEEEPEPYLIVGEPPEFPGGTVALKKFVATHLVYPVEALENNIQGRVFVRFVVSSDGSVKRIEITRGLHPLLDEEATRVISSLPLWKPGRQNGKPVPVWFSMPVTFQIIDN